MYQRIEIIGVAGRDPVTKTAQNGKLTTTFSVAVNPYGGKNTEQKPIWFQVTAWEKLAEYIGEYCQKGTMLFCEGRLFYNPETGCPRLNQRQDGSVFASFEIVAQKIQLLSNYKGRDQATQSAIPW